MGPRATKASFPLPGTLCAWELHRPLHTHCTGLAYDDLVDYEIVKAICAARRGAQRAAAVLRAASPSS
jgi:hypothetical protein